MKKSLSGLFWVSLMQGGNYLLPAIAIPVLVRYLGPADYGVFNLSQTWALYFSVIIAYGFELSATKEVTSLINNKSTISEIYSKVIQSKIYLFFILLAIFLALIQLNPNLKEYFFVYVVMYLWTLSTVFFQGWLYLGLEKPASVSVFNFLSRAIAFFILLLFVHLKFSLLALVLGYVLPQIIAAYVFHIHTISHFKIDIRLYSLSDIFYFLKQSFGLFLSTMAGTITISLSTIILGFLSTKENVGYFSVSTKIVSLVFGLILYPFQIVLFPIFLRKIKESSFSGFNFFYKVLIGSSLIMGTIISAIYLFSEEIIRLFVGDGFELSIYSLKIICWVPLFALADTLFGYLLISLEKREVYTRILLLGSIFCLILNLGLTPDYNLIGSSYAWLCAEIGCFICFLLYFCLRILPLVKSSKTQIN